VYSLVPAEKER